MTSFSDRLTKAKQHAVKQHRDVDVYLDDDTAERITALEEEIAAHEQAIVQAKRDLRMGDTRPAELAEQIAAVRERIAGVQAEAAESRAVLRFRRLPAEEWADIVSHCPARIDAMVDRMYGYNVHEASREAAPASGVLIERGEDGSEVETPVTDEEWDELFGLLSGRDFGRLCDAIFGLNEHGPQQRLDAARKASRAGSGSTSN